MAFSGLGSGVVGDPYQITTPAQFREMDSYIIPTFTGVGVNDCLPLGFQQNQTSPGTNTITIDGVGGIKTSTKNNGGTGYTAGNTFTVNTGGLLATGIIYTVSAGAVLTYGITSIGSGYTVTNNVSTTTTSGVGVGFRINVTAIQDTFKWKYNSGAETTRIPIVANQGNYFSSGIQCKFLNETGHTIGDNWVFQWTTKYHFKLMNDLNFSGETVVNKGFSLYSFIHTLSGNSKTISGCVLGAGKGIQLTDNGVFLDTTFRFSSANNTSYGFNPTLFYSSDNLDNVRVERIHVVVTGGARLYSFVDTMCNATTSFKDIVVEGNIGGVFTQAVRGTIENLKVLRNTPLRSSSNAGNAIVKELDGGIMKKCQVIFPTFYLKNTASYMDYTASLLVGRLSGQLEECFAMSNMDYEFYNISADTACNGLVGSVGNGLNPAIKNSYFVGSFKTNGGLVAGETYNPGKQGYAIINGRYKTVQNCYFSGDMTTPFNDNRPVLKATSADGSITNSYYDSDKIIGMTDVSVAGQQQGLTTAQMADTANFNTWNFSTIWAMGADGKPYLRNNPIYNFELPARMISVTGMVRNSSTGYTITAAADWFTTGATPSYGFEVYHNGVLQIDVTNAKTYTATVSGLSDYAVQVRPYYLDGAVKVYDQYFNDTFYCLDQAFIQPTVITATQKVTFNTPIDAKFIHGSLIYGDYVYGSTRNTVGSAVFPCFTRALKTNLSGYEEIQIKISDASAVKGTDIEQIVEVGGKIYGRMNGQYIIQYDPNVNDYKIYLVSMGSGSSEPLITDGTYLYLINGSGAYKVHPNNFSGSTKYNTATNWTVTSAGYYNSASQGGHILGGWGSGDKGQVHSGCADSEYLYLAYTTGGNYNPTYGQSLNECQKIKTSDMTPAGWCAIPKCTDDQCQTETHLFLGVEVQPSANVLSMGYGWGAIGIRKSDMHMTAIPKFSKYDNPPTGNQSYASLLFGNYILDARTDGNIYALDISDVDNWLVTEPVAKRTLMRYNIIAGGSLITNSAPINEIMLNDTGKFYGFMWANPSSLTEFELTGLNYFAAPTVTTIGSSVTGQTATLTGYILNTGGKIISSKGFHYGISPSALTTTITSAESGTTFHATLSALDPGTYYYQAFAVNSEGESTNATVESFAIDGTIFFGTMPIRRVYWGEVILSRG